MGSERLHARLTAAGLGRVAKDIIEIRKPSIRLHLQRMTDPTNLALGRSKIGGAPDLPPGKNWPTWQDSPMAFIGQVNLADIAAHDEEGLLPHSGLLSFFCAIDGTAAGVMGSLDDPSSWRVSHFDGDQSTLVQLPFPAELPELLKFPACQTSFSREPTLPDLKSREIRGLLLSAQEQDIYIDVESGADVSFVNVFNHHMLGHPYILTESPFVAGYLKDHGIADPYALVPHLSDEELGRQLSLRNPQHQWKGLQDLRDKANAEWMLLLQVYSNDEAEMDLAGGGVLHFCIPKEALSKRDFDRVWVDMQFL
jgi:uncharacterized protein YwqG